MDKGGSLLQRSFATMGRNFGTLIAAAAWPYALVAVCMMCLATYFRARYAGGPPQDFLQLWHSMGAGTKLGWMVLYLATGGLPHGFAVAGVAAVVWKDLQTESAGLGDAFSAIGPVFWRLIAMALGVFIAAGMGSFLVLPGLAVSFFCAFAFTILVVERTGVWDAIGKSSSFAWSRPGTVLGLYFVVGSTAMVVIVVGVMLLTLLPLDLPWAVGMTAAWLCFVAFISSTLTVLGTILTQTYAEERERREELATSAQAVA